MEKVIYTWYNFMSSAKVSACTLKHNPNKHIDHSCECGLKLTITVPDGYHISESYNYDAMLVKDGCDKGIVLQYNIALDRIEEAIPLTITFPDGYHISESDNDDSMLVKDVCDKDIVMQYNIALDRIEEGIHLSLFGAPIKGVRILRKEEF